MPLRSPFRRRSGTPIDDGNPFGNRAPKVNDPDLLRRRSTVAGMADWGGTGPVGTQCWQCTHWRFHGYRFDGTLPPEPCHQFAVLTNMPVRRAPRVHPEQPSCKYYQPRTPQIAKFAPK